MKRSTDPRHLARILVIQKLFSTYFDSGDNEREDVSIEDLLSIGEIKKYDKELYKKLFEGVEENRPKLDEIITQYAPQWPLAQMKLVDLQILRISIYEAFVGMITPPKVAIDEAIEIAKEFGGDVSGKFVNGILGALYEVYKKENHEKETTANN